MSSNGHGGYRKPANPAPVSGPGEHSRRTDGGVKHMDLPSARYGEQKAYQEQQSAAPLNPPKTAMAGTFPAAPQGPGIAEQLAGLTPLDAPTQNPDEPVTAGAATGPGVGPDALGITPAAAETRDLAKLRAYLPALLEMANRPDATQSFINYVRELRARAT